jgi:hypothetical protein
LEHKEARSGFPMASQISEADNSRTLWEAKEAFWEAKEVANEARR